MPVITHEVIAETRASEYLQRVQARIKTDQPEIDMGYALGFHLGQLPNNSYIFEINTTKEVIIDRLTTAMAKMKKAVRDTGPQYLEKRYFLLMSDGTRGASIWCVQQPGFSVVDRARLWKEIDIPEKPINPIDFIHGDGANNVVLLDNISPPTLDSSSLQHLSQELDKSGHTHGIYWLQPNK